MSELIDENSEKTGPRHPPKEYQFKPGQSGNPRGRPRNPLKDFSLREFNEWTDAQKRAFLKKVAPIDRWKMTEGNPQQDIGVSGEVTTKIISVDE